MKHSNMEDVACLAWRIHKPEAVAIELLAEIMRYISIARSIYEDLHGHIVFRRNFKRTGMESGEIARYSLGLMNAGRNEGQA